jgi:GNAT superfamily N-acetyltransferase
MYVRYTQRCVEGRLLDPVFEIANVEVATSQRGKGIFSRFLEEVISLCPDTAIYVECVHNERLATMLQKRGFQNVRGSDFLLRDPSEYRKENV